MVAMPAADLTNDEQIADLERRAENAMQIAEAAEAAGDEAKMLRALERYFLRLEQAKYAFERPEDSICPPCKWGEDSWPVAHLLIPQRPLWACLDHWDGATPVVAARMRDVTGENAGAACYGGEEAE